MGNRLYVGNLSFNTTREAIEAAFLAVGPVTDISIPTDRDTGRVRGFAFVTMSSAQDATNAISKLDGIMLDGRPLRVNEAQERAFGAGSFGGRPGGRSRR